MSIIIGLVTIGLGIAGMAVKWGDVTGFQMFLKAIIATVPALLVASGIIAVVSGISGFINKGKTDKPEQPEEGK